MLNWIKKIKTEIGNPNLNIVAFKADASSFEDAQATIDEAITKLGGVDILINNRFDSAVEVLTAGIEKLQEIEGIDAQKAEEIIEITLSEEEQQALQKSAESVQALEPGLCLTCLDRQGLQMFPRSGLP